MKQYRIKLHARGPEQFARYIVERELVTDVPDRMSRRAVLEAAATSMGLNLEPGAMNRIRSTFATWDVAGSNGRAHITCEIVVTGSVS
jgi:hypothetical protein